MGKRLHGRYRGPKGAGYFGVSEKDPTLGEAILDEAFEEAAIAVKDAITAGEEPEDFFERDFDAHVEVGVSRENQNVRTYKVIIIT